MINTQTVNKAQHISGLSAYTSSAININLLLSRLLESLRGTGKIK